MVLFIVLYKVNLILESVGEIFKCDHSNESYWVARFFGATTSDKTLDTDPPVFQYQPHDWTPQGLYKLPVSPLPGEHYHLALKLNRNQRWLSSKTSLCSEYGITVNYSSHHHNYYSGWEYVTKSDSSLSAWARGPFLETPDNFSGPKTIFILQKLYNFYSFWKLNFNLNNSVKHTAIRLRQ